MNKTGGILPSFSGTIVARLTSVVALINSNPLNATGVNATDSTHPPPWNLLELISIGLVLVTIVVCCVVGNLFVILAIILERDLRRVQYYLIFSLAVADLLVGLIVTPLAAVAELQRRWQLGVRPCDFWISMDVLLCTSSILHLVAIALDRYWSITDICYMQNRTPKRIFTMLSIVWVVSLLISVAPIFGWKDEHFVTRVTIEKNCLISQELSYQVFSTATAFYIPLIAIIGIYYKIFRAAKRRFKRERDRKTVNRPPPNSKSNSAASAGPCNTPANHLKVASVKSLQMLAVESEAVSGVSAASTEGEDGSGDLDDERTPMQIANGRQRKSSACEPTLVTQIETCLDNDELHRKSNASDSLNNVVQPPSTPKSARFRIKKNPKKVRTEKQIKESAELKREKKAWRTLAIITGTFVACWLPFFLISLYRPICRCPIPPAIESVTAWLGYLNSAINPIIYTIFSPDFRQAFQRILRRICFMHDTY